MIDRRLIDSATGLVDLDLWRERLTLGTSVGRCRCGSPLTPGEPDVDRHVTWLPVRCGNRHQQTLIAERPVRSVARA